MALGLLGGLACATLLAGCESAPDSGVPLPPTSSLLAVEVLLPVPFGRDLSLVQVFFWKGPVGDGEPALPELIPASFVKQSCAYLLDPEPGDYGVAAVTAEYAPPFNPEPVAGVANTVWSDISSDALIFPAELIRSTTTPVARGEVAFMGVLRLRRGEHIDASTLPKDAVQARIAERIRPGVLSKSGLRGWLERVRYVDLENTSLARGPAEREAFLAAAVADLGVSPWARVVAGAAAAGETPAARSPAPRLPTPSSVGRPAATPPGRAPREPVRREPAAPEPGRAAPAPMPPAPPPPAPEPSPQPFPGVPPDSPLAQITLGMDHDEVRARLGEPDGRRDYQTRKAWIPFYDGPDADLRDWLYVGKGRVVFSLYKGRLEVIDVVYDPDQRIERTLRPFRAPSGSR
jgi:hypothetical protein